MTAITSPLFVRSYLTFQVDPVRGVLVLKPGDDYRWRSEGYATTRIGVMGMPGGPPVVPEKNANEIRIAVWGDSQAEGVCVADTDKLHQQIQSRADQAGCPLSVFPMARSGDDLSDWLVQIPRVESKLGVDVHVLLIAELADLDVVLPGVTAESSSPVLPPLTLRNRIVQACPAFLIQAIRQTLSNPDDTPRQLRFRVGPVENPGADLGTERNIFEEAVVPTPEVRNAEDSKGIIESIIKSTEKTIVVVYAPIIPVSLKASQSEHDQETWLKPLTVASDRREIIFIDMREMLLRSAEANRWPHGFHNGQFGVGHLNAVGYELIAGQVVETLGSASRLTTSKNGD